MIKSVSTILWIAMLMSCKENDQTIKEPNLKWASYSMIMLDTNVIVNIPNVIKLKNGIEPECMGDPEMSIFQIVSVIGLDTVKAEIRSIVSVYPSNNIKVKKEEDSVLLNRMERKLKSEYPNVQIQERKTIDIGGEKVGKITYVLGSVPYCQVLYKNGSRCFKFEFEGIKDNDVLSQMISSIRFESKMKFLCF